jgi:hypothetical protein
MTRFVATVVNISRSTAGPTRTSVREWDLSPGAARLGYRISDQPSSAGTVLVIHKDGRLRIGTVPLAVP